MNTKAQQLSKGLLKQSFGLFILMALALFLPAGTVDWAAGWLFLILFFSFFLAVSLWLLRYNPGLLEERLHFSAPSQKGWDRLLFPILSLFPVVWLAFIAFDAGRFHWSPLPVWLQGVGLGILGFSFYLFFLTFRENSYLSTVVRIQADRGHSVVSTGPYRYVRHPMYTGIVAFMLGTPLLLGSGYGILVGLFLVAVLARRAVLEESTLREELTGYVDYMAQVKYRFVPHIW